MTSPSQKLPKSEFVARDQLNSAPEMAQFDLPRQREGK